MTRRLLALLAFVPLLVTCVPGEPAYQIATWAPWTHLDSVRTSLKRELGSLDVVHPFWYTMAADGTITASSSVDPGLVSELKGAGAKVVPTLTDGFAAGRAHGVFTDPARRTRHLDAIVALVTGKGYDGIDLDYEALASGDRDLFSAFVEDLAARLHAAGKLVTLAVYPKTSEPGSWAGPISHDYARLAAAADRLNIMGYGYATASGSPRPIGPVHWLRRVVEFAVTVAPPEKIVLGVPFYGRDWPEGGSGKALVSADVKELLARYHPAVRYDTEAGESTFTYTDGAGKKHTVWFQSPEGMAAKMELVTTHRLKGMVAWRIGSEDPALWTKVREKLRPADALKP